MTEFLAAAAEALNAPEELVRRSAEAKAAATGVSADDLLAAWAGGTAAPAASQPAPPAPATPEPAEPPSSPKPPPEPESAGTEAARSEPAAVPAPSPPAPPPPSTATAPPAPVPPAAPPILEGRRDRPFLVMAGAAALLVVAVLIGFVMPALPEEGNGVYTSAVPLSEAGKDGRDLYRSQGCEACHTQMVRPLVADAGLGGVTIDDSNQVLGLRRYGPDLAHIGARTEDPGRLVAILEGEGGHPAYSSIGAADIDALVAYLMESR